MTKYRFSYSKAIYITVFIIALAAVTIQIQLSSRTSQKKEMPDTTTESVSLGKNDNDRAKQLRQVYDNVNSSIPDYIFKRKSPDLEHAVSQDEAIAEITRLRRSLRQRESSFRGESSGFQGKSRTFKEWKRIEMGGSESHQELDNAGHHSTGPNGEILLHNGELFFDKTDMSLSSRAGLGFNFRRIYRSHVDYNGSIGYGWDHNHNQRLIVHGESVDEADRIIWLNGTRRISFYKEDGSWQPEAGAFYKLEIERNSVIIYSPRLLCYTFQPAVKQAESKLFWRIVSIATRHDDGQANVIRYSYADNSDLLKSATDPFGKRVYFSYNSKGNLTQLRSGNIVVQYSYDEHSNLVAVTHKAIALSYRNTEDIETRYKYDAINARSRLSAIIRPGGEFRKDFIYEHKNGMEDRVSGIRQTDIENGEKTVAEWDITVDSATTQMQVSVKPPEPAPEEVVYSFKPDHFIYRLLPKSIYIPSRDAEWSYKYNEDGLTTREKHPLGDQTIYAYERSESPLRRGNKISEIHRPRPDAPLTEIVEIGSEWKYHPDISRPVKEINYQLEENGERRVLLETHYEYDSNYDLLKETTGNESYWKIRNSYGMPVAEIDGRGAVTLYQYYGEFNEGTIEVNRGGLLAETIRDADPEVTRAWLRRAGIDIPDELPQRDIESEPVSLNVKHDYTNEGHLEEEERAFYAVHYIRNKDGALLGRYDTRGDLVLAEYDEADRKIAEHTRYSFPANTEYTGERIAGLRGRFYSQEFDYDPPGNLTRWKQSKEPCIEGGKELIIEYSYYPSGELKTRTSAAGISVNHEYDTETGFISRKYLTNDEDDEELNMKYDMEFTKSGELLKYRDDYGQKHVYEIDAFGRTYAHIRPDGVRTESHYDGLGRLVTEEMLAPGGETLSKEKITYDDAGNIKIKKKRRISFGEDGLPDGRVDEWLIKSENSYDAAGNLKRTRSYREDAYKRYKYDGLNRVVKEAGPEGDFTEYLYRNDRLILEANTLFHTDNGESHTVYKAKFYDNGERPWLNVPVGENKNPVFERSEIAAYDSQGRQIKETDPKRAVKTTFYDSLDRKKSRITHPLFSKFGEPQQVLSFDYDADGRKLERRFDNNPIAIFAMNAEVNENYLLLAQHFSELDFEQVTEYKYDRFGRLVYKKSPDGKEERRHYGEDSLVDQIEWSHAEDETFRESISFEYDELGRPVEIRKGGRILQRFRYDYFDNIIYGEDHGNPDAVVETKRNSDNFDNILSKRTSVRGDINFPGALIEWRHNLKEGVVDVSVSEVPRQADTWENTSYKSDLNGRTVSVATDGKKIAEYDYVGNQPVSTQMPAGNITRNIRLNDMLEPVEYDFSEKTSAKSVCDVKYILGSKGKVAASSTILNEPQMEKSKFYKHDSYGQLVAEGDELRSNRGRLEKRREEILADPTEPASWRVWSSTFDAAGNLSRQRRGIRNAPDLDMPQAVRYFSPGRPLAFSPDKLQQRDMDFIRRRLKDKAESQLDLASNRLGSVASPGTPVSEYNYDPRGRLTNYVDDDEKEWKIKYDVLGRVIGMESSGGEQEEALELEFASDIFNRRIIKNVISKEALSATIYSDVNPLLVMSHSKGSWNTSAQYLWQKDSRKIIMAALPVEKVEGINSMKRSRYYFHQDRMNNVFLCTGNRTGDVEVHDVAAYWGFGENATRGRIKNITSTEILERGSRSEYAHNGLMDPGKEAKWIAGENYGRVTIKLDELAEISSLAIWTDSFPEAFNVYVIPKVQNAEPSGEEIEEWSEKANEQGWRAAENQEAKPSDIRIPYEIRLGNLSGEAVVVTWEDYEGGFSIRELELTIKPRNPSSLAFSGAWLDEETGLYYHTARYRHPSMAGKFISPDPLGYFDGQNLYAYAQNDPLSYYDPEGEFARVVVGAGAGAFIGGGSYALQVWITGEEWDTRRFLIRSGSGALAGATFALVGPAFTYDVGTAGSMLQAATMKGLSQTPGGVVGGYLGAGSDRLMTGRFIFGETWGDAISAANKRGFQGAAIGGTTGFFAGAIQGGVQFRNLQQTRQLSIAQEQYKRPKFSRAERGKVWSQNIEKRTGRVRDPVTGKFMSKSKNWDVGHKPGHEFWKARNTAIQKGTHPELFNRQQKDLSIYRPELPSSNRSHIGEDLTDLYLGL